MNIIKKQSVISFSFNLIIILAFSLLISGCGGGTTAGLSLVGDNNPGDNQNPISPIDLIPSNPPPPAPVITTAEATTNSIYLKWMDESPRESGFLVIRDGIQVGETDKNVSQWTDASVLPATTYTYIVVAWNKEGSNASPEKTVTTPAVPVPVPPKWILPGGGNTHILSLAVDQTTGELYAAGMTEVALTDAPHNGRHDEFLAKFNPDGTLAWLKQWGTPYADLILGDFLAISNGNIYVLCQCNDVSGLGGGNTHVTAFDSQGTILRIVDLGNVGAESITADDNGVYIAYSKNNIGHIAKFDYQASDPLIWDINMWAMHIKAYGGAIYVNGIMGKIDTDTGNILQTMAPGEWNSQLYGYVDGSAVDASGVYLIGQGVAVPLTALKYSHDLAKISANIFSTQSGLLTGSSPALSDTSMYIAVGGLGLFRIDKATLELVWNKTDIKGEAVAFIGDTVFVADRNKIIPVDALTGSSLP